MEGPGPLVLSHLVYPEPVEGKHELGSRLKTAGEV